VERLEDRTVPTVTASVTNGSLVIKGDSAAGSTLAITASDVDADGVADTFTVTDGTTAVGTFSGVTKDVVLRLSANDDAVTIDLKGLTAPRNVVANLGDGTNSLTLDNGTVKGSVSVLGGAGTDTVTLGGTAAVTVDGNANFNLGDAADDVLHLGKATVEGWLSAVAANDITLDDASTVGHGVWILGGTGGNTVSLNGTVEGSVAFIAPWGSTAGSDVTIAGTVDGGVTVQGSSQADTLTVTGDIGGSLRASLGGGDDTASIGGTVTGNLILDGGAGNDTLTLSGLVGGRTSVTGGAGDDKFTVAATADLTGNATVNLGAGNDTCTVDDAATIATLVVNGGSGTDTFVGTKTKTGLKLVSFEA
jgi:hypothetical protein